jgi:glycine/D-amino acid oxidase-like deaminating enzyme
MEVGMDHIPEPARRTPVAMDCDVCVIGGSTTGAFAAVAAARRGASVAIVEALGYFGGTATASMVCVWHSDMDTEFRRPIAAGLPRELIDRLDQRGAVITHEASPHWKWAFNPAEMACELDAMVVEAGIRPLLHARFVAAIVEDGRVTAAVVEDKTGRRAIRARVFIDATGDADLAHRAHLACYRQPRLQPPTACALVRGLGTIRQANAGFTLNDAVFDPQYPEALRPGFCWAAPVPGADEVTMIAGTRVHGADCSDADQLTRAEIEGRRQIRSMVDLLRRHFREGEQLTLLGVPARIGVRHSRQVHCLHRLTEQEVLGGARFDDAVANGSYRVDLHHADDGGVVFRYLDGREVLLAPGLHEERRWREPLDQDPTFYQIPYRCLVPRDSQNVLVAGRCLDADEGAFGAIRVMINCVQTGEAAGAAAALAMSAGCDVADVPMDKLRQSLSDGGAVVISC